MGTTFAILSLSGNGPVTKDSYIRTERSEEMGILSIFNNLIQKIYYFLKIVLH